MARAQSRKGHHLQRLICCLMMGCSTVILFLLMVTAFSVDHAGTFFNVGGHVQGGIIHPGTGVRVPTPKPIPGNGGIVHPGTVGRVPFRPTPEYGGIVHPGIGARVPIPMTIPGNGGMVHPRTGGRVPIPWPTPEYGGIVHPGIGGRVPIPMTIPGNGGIVHPGTGGKVPKSMPIPGNGGIVHPGTGGKVPKSMPIPGNGGIVHPGTGGRVQIPKPIPKNGGKVRPGNGGRVPIPKPLPGNGEILHPGTGGRVPIQKPIPGNGGRVHSGTGGRVPIPMPIPGNGGIVHPGTAGRVPKPKPIPGNGGLGHPGTGGRVPIPFPIPGFGGGGIQVPGRGINLIKKVTGSWKLQFPQGSFKFDVSNGDILINGSPVNLVASINHQYPTSQGWLQFTFDGVPYYVKISHNGVRVVENSGRNIIPATTTVVHLGTGGRVQISFPGSTGGGIQVPGRGISLRYQERINIGGHDFLFVLNPSGKITIDGNPIHLKASTSTNAGYLASNGWMVFTYKPYTFYFKKVNGQAQLALSFGGQYYPVPIGGGASVTRTQTTQTIKFAQTNGGTCQSVTKQVCGYLAQAGGDSLQEGAANTPAGCYNYKFNNKFYYKDNLNSQTPFSNQMIGICQEGTIKPTITFGDQPSKEHE